MLQSRSRFIYASCSLTVLIVGCLHLNQSILGANDTLNPNVENELLEEHEDHFSIEQQLGNKTRINRYHLPLAHGTTWCGNISVWNEYATFHHDVIHGHRSSNGYLRYYCRAYRCGGYGNRIQAITVGLIMAMLTNRVFLLEMTYPVNLLNYITPNAVQWDVVIVPRSIVTHDLYGPSRIKRYWSSFANDLLTDGGAEMIEFRSNEGFGYFYSEIVKSPEILQQFLSLGADNRTNYGGLYGCAVKYLFNPRSITTWAVTSQLTNLGLVTGKYVAVHIRTSLSSLDSRPRHASPIEWKKFLDCAVRTSHLLAKKLELDSVPIYLASDEDVVKEYAIQNFSNNQVVLSQVYTLHVDRPRVKTVWLLHEGFLGMLTDMEVLSRAAILIKSHSTFSDVIEGLGFFRKNESYMYNHCPYSL